MNSCCNRKYARRRPDQSKPVWQPKLPPPIMLLPPPRRQIRRPGGYSGPPGADFHMSTRFGAPGTVRCEESKSDTHRSGRRLVGWGGKQFACGVNSGSNTGFASLGPASAVPVLQHPEQNPPLRCAREPVSDPQAWPSPANPSLSNLQPPAPVSPTWRKPRNPRRSPKCSTRRCTPSWPGCRWCRRRATPKCGRTCSPTGPPHVGTTCG